MHLAVFNYVSYTFVQSAFDIVIIVHLREGSGYDSGGSGVPTLLRGALGHDGGARVRVPRVHGPGPAVRRRNARGELAPPRQGQPGKPDSRDAPGHAARPQCGLPAFVENVPF